jgi:hypothetical protein
MKWRVRYMRVNEDVGALYPREQREEHATEASALETAETMQNALTRWIVFVEEVQ